MVEAPAQFEYVAINGAGRRTSGAVSATSEAAAFEQLKAKGLAPTRIRRASRSGPDERGPSNVRLVGTRDLADFLTDLATLLGSGAGMRAALSILASKAGRPSVRALAKSLSVEISGGGAVHQAFADQLGRDHAFVGALISAGEAAGDLASGLKRAADLITARIRLRDQLVSSLSYPAFVFSSTIVAIAVILIFVIPSLSPLVEDSGAPPPATLAMMIAISRFLNGNLLTLGLLGGAIALGGPVLWWSGLLKPPLERALLGGPFRRTASGLIFGGFAIALGDMLAAGAPISDALRLSIRSVPWAAAREQLEPIAQAVRQGEQLSDAFSKTGLIPDVIVRLSAVGEASGVLGPMLARAGKIEEDAAIRRIEAASRILGPLLIVGLGGMIGLLMAGLLSSVSQLGQSALQ